MNQIQIKINYNNKYYTLTNKMNTYKQKIITQQLSNNKD